MVALRSGKHPLVGVDLSHTCQHMPHYVLQTALRKVNHTTYTTQTHVTHATQLTQAQCININETKKPFHKLTWGAGITIEGRVVEGCKSYLSNIESHINSIYGKWISRVAKQSLMAFASYVRQKLHDKVTHSFTTNSLAIC